MEGSGSGCDGKHANFTNRASYCEIYNEAIYDLLNFTNQQLAIRWDAAKGFHVPDLYIKECAEVTDLLQVRSSSSLSKFSLDINHRTISSWKG